ncbi:MAG: right-handed parallel beta-helix repeat-containing protein, partial [Tepidisphaeraceae bacterium]
MLRPKYPTSRRRSRQILGRAASACESLERRTLMASILVNSDASNTPAGDGLVTLREAINAANSDSTTDLGQTGSGADTITFDLGAGAHQIILTNVLPGLNSTIEIQGPGADLLTIGRNSLIDFRIFWNPFRNNITLSGMTITGGKTTQDGGAVFSNGTLTVNDCVITGNIARFGGEISNQNIGHLTVNNCTISGNTATGGSGGIDNFQNSDATISNCTFSNNSVTNSNAGGGGIRSTSGCSLVVANCTFTGNTAAFNGGGINNSGTANVSNSTFSGNSTGTNGGGGILNTGTLTVTASTFNDNHSDQDTGGGIYNYFGTVSVSNSTLTGNTAYD